jgi:hypothetical protein
MIEEDAQGGVEQTDAPHGRIFARTKRGKRFRGSPCSDPGDEERRYDREVPVGV